MSINLQARSGSQPAVLARLSERPVHTAKGTHRLGVSPLRVNRWAELNFGGHERNGPSLYTRQSQSYLINLASWLYSSPVYCMVGLSRLIKMASSIAVILLLILCCLLVTQTASAPAPLRRSPELPAQLLKDVAYPTRSFKSSRGSSGFTCEACKFIVDRLQELFVKNATEDEIAKIITRFCIDFKIDDENVCSLAVITFKVSTLAS